MLLWAFAVWVLEIPVWLVSVATMVMTLNTLMICIETITKASKTTMMLFSAGCKVWHLSTQSIKLASIHFL